MKKISSTGQILSSKVELKEGMTIFCEDEKGTLTLQEGSNDGIWTAIDSEGNQWKVTNHDLIGSYILK